ncbi:hypothetical protein INR49_023653, partial [Caranx melampygus]
ELRKVQSLAAQTLEKRCPHLLTKNILETLALTRYEERTMRAVSEAQACRPPLLHLHLPQRPPHLRRLPVLPCHSVRLSLLSSSLVEEEVEGMPCWLTSRKEPGSGKSHRSTTAVPLLSINPRPVLEMYPAVLVLLRVHQQG